MIGIDVGYSPTSKSSAVCRLDWTSTEASFSIGRFRALEPERSQVLLRYVNRPIFAAAFDGPLRSDLSEIGRYRLAERILTRQLQPFIGKPGQANAPVGRELNKSANACATIVLEIGHLVDASHRHAIHQSAIVEAFPGSFLGLMIDDPKHLQADRGNRSDIFYSHLVQSGGLDRLLQYLLPGRVLIPSLDGVKNHDDRAALVCAITALCVAAGDYTAVGDNNGWIVLPPRSFIRQWAWPLLAANAHDGGLEWQEVTNLRPSGDRVMTQSAGEGVAS